MSVNRATTFISQVPGLALQLVAFPCWCHASASRPGQDHYPRGNGQDNPWALMTLAGGSRDGRLGMLYCLGIKTELEKNGMFKAMSSGNKIYTFHLF